jgi:factor associated with neutral sphingomyelinase activation
MSSRDARSKCRVITVGRDSALKASCATDGASKHVSEAGAVGKAPLSSLALWPPSSSANGATATVFAGSYDGAVRAYALSVNGKDYGVVGRLPAHDAAVAAVAIPALDRSKLFTASWDGAVRAWDVGAGGVLGGAFAARVLQSSSSSAPPLGAVGTPARRARRAGAAPWVASTSDLNAEAWCLACDPTGDTVFAGGEDGAAIAWDPRYRHAAWRADACPSGRGVHALSVMPCRTRVAAACGDGVVRTLELRMCGESSAEMNLGIGPLSCVLANGARGVLAGGKKHEGIVAWDPDGFHPERCFRVAGVDGPRGAGVSCASVASDGGALVLGWDDGSVGVFAET